MLEVQKVPRSADRARDHTPRPATANWSLQRVVQLVINKLLHHPTTVLRGSPKDEGALRAAGLLAELSALTPGGGGGGGTERPVRLQNGRVPDGRIAPRV